MSTVKDFKYNGRDFSQFRDRIIEFTKQYFPETYNDFNETSPGMLFIESAAMVGDVLSYYTDHALRENMLQYAQERDNLIKLARALGYKAKATVPSTVELDVFCIVPAKTVGASTDPDMAYAPVVETGMQCSTESNPDLKFTTLTEVDFTQTGSADNAVTVFSIDDTSGLPTNYLIKKQVKAISGEKKSETFTIPAVEKFKQLKLEPTNVVHVESVVDDAGNSWYEVPYLAQDTIFEQIKNTEANSPLETGNATDASYLLKLRRTARRFTTSIDSGSNTYIQFGAGISSNPDELIVPNPETIGNVLANGATQDLDKSFDPANIMFTRAYGQAPLQGTITVNYLAGGGIDSNVVSGDINTIDSKTVSLDEDGLTEAITQGVKDSIAVSNPLPATGGKDAESLDEIRYNAMSSYASQNRAVTLEDYVSRVYSMPAKFGSVAKAYVAQNDLLSSTFTSQADSDVIDDQSQFNYTNPLAIDLYVLAYAQDKKLQNASATANQNVQTYLSQYRMLTDAVNIRNALVCNIGIDFEIVPRMNANGKAVILRCIEALKQYFDIDKWQIYQPIIVSDVQNYLDKVEGVQMVTKLEFINKVSVSSGYSGNVYDIASATNNNIIYPSLDPMIWEIKYPDTDIRGKVVGL